MKKLLIVIGFNILIIFSAFSNGHFFRANAVINFNRLESSVTIRNFYRSSLYCKGKVYGITYGGQYVYSYMNKIIYPSEFAQVYLFTNYLNPFVRIRDRIYCQILN